jgi:hypothetical protein
VSDPSPSPPAAEYRDRLGRRRATLAALTRTDVLLSRARLATFAVAILLAVLAWRGLAIPFWLLVPVAVFLGLALKHDRVIRGSKAAQRAIAFYERGLARLEDHWAGEGEAGERFADDNHLYAKDLDIFGRGSLFQLLSIARTRAGEQILSEWLKAPAGRDEILARHEALRELTPALDLREQIALAGSDVRAAVDPDALIAWAERGVILKPPVIRLLAMATTAAVVLSAILVLRDQVPGVAFLIALAAQGVMSTVQRRNVEGVLHSSDAPAIELGVLRHVLARLEQEQFTTPRLASVRAQLESDAERASQVIGRLRLLVELHDWQHNIVFAPIAAMLLWDTHVAWAIERWRLANGVHVRRWLDAAGQFEAFSSLAAYRYEHPDDPFPEILAPDPQSPIPNPHVEGVALGHPLIPSAQMVRNDLSLSGDVRLLVVSGSNMSGKSTMLRTVGINAVLAMAGAPVRAASLRLAPMAIGATLRIQDSLQEGRSRFYAEITRIRELSDVAKRGEPLLFLLDELFHGTNSHDRLVGASGVLRGLLERGAIGLITTHDLALTAIADALAPRAVNVHFEDWFDGAEIRFDYRMKPGPVTRSNAVALMRAVGLDVPIE